MEEVILEEWSVVYKGDIYKAPEQRSTCLSGKVYGHSHHKDGKNVVTSSIMHADGRDIFTRNTKYKLGKASQEYKDWYVKNYGKELDENNPFDGKEV